MNIVHRARIAQCFHRNFINIGYRKVDSFPQALMSLFIWHNETMNTWSHLIGFICVTIAGINLSREVLLSSNNVKLTELVALEAYFITAACCLLFSTLLHWFGCVSENCYQNLLLLDLSGVALLIVGSYLPLIYYGFHRHPSLQQNYFYFTIGILIIGLIAPWITTTYKGNYIRPYILAANAVVGLLPIIHWTIITPTLYKEALSKYFIQMLFWYGIGFVIFITHVPERLFPDNFWSTYVFSSHTLWHYCVMNAVYVWFYFLLKYRTMLTEDGVFNPVTAPLLVSALTLAVDSNSVNSYQVF